MNRTLLILEVSRKQDYIFSSNHLRDNADRSDIIRYVTSAAFFESAAPEFYTEKNYVYAGGGHTILQFEDADTARKFAEKVTYKAMHDYDGLELFARQMDYQASLTPGDNLLELSKALERKKSLRRASFCLGALGIEGKPVKDRRERYIPKPLVEAPAGWEFAKQFEDLLGKTDENFIAVVHIDGNAMGVRVQEIYKGAGDSWERCCGRLRRFSEGIQSDFEQAFCEMACDVAAHEADNPAGHTSVLPVRPVILAGDDVCFVARGSLGLACADRFIHHLSRKTNAEDGQRYAACAGVAMVHLKYPFHQAYDLSEALCSSAKKCGVALCEDSSACIMDWHIEFGQLKENLGEIRQDYRTEDGRHMELRPVVVLPGNMDAAARDRVNVRTYPFVRGLCVRLQQVVKNSGDRIARSKLKELRSAIKQGELECRYALQDGEITHLLRTAFDAEHSSAEEQLRIFLDMLKKQVVAEHKPFRDFDDGGRNGSEIVSHCLFFDAIEMMDHFEQLEDLE